MIYEKERCSDYRSVKWGGDQGQEGIEPATVTFQIRTATRLSTSVWIGRW